MKCTVEICCGSYYDAKQAELGGATRIELNSALFLGGLTPSVGSLRLSKENTSLKVIAMVRPRAGGFCYLEEDYQTVLKDVESMMENGADGIAFGILDKTGMIDLDKCKQVITLVKRYGQEKEIVFHRAFDCVSNPYEAIETLIELGVDRILTSGLQAKAVHGMKLLKELQDKYGNQIEILAGSGINVSNAVDFMKETKINQVHSSCKQWLIDETTTMENVSYAYHDKNDYDVVSSELVEELINECNVLKQDVD